ncbi:cytochrome c oxidase assembly protein [Acidisoma cladoniae]|jgi:cytochrome c oxidase assembly protein subunit 11|uniref:cytochrome c oxidase assembly protein n=1 Tax=Acidisoma cladoniae TaxID=3040935 RepID=UPI00254D0B40|nr:cytochrome c oxidase assembly protein [Acidisoma sp. PAMC 29798]
MRGRTVTLLSLCLVIAVMVTLVSFSVPLYRLFCEATGYNGTTQRVTADTVAPTASNRRVTVYFTTSTESNLPWTFEPVQDHVTVKLGQEALVFFRATNHSNEDIVGRALFNVQPDKAGLYFKKVQCFCFTQERLKAGESVTMPVDFFVDPRLATADDTADVDQITLSYTFFRATHANDITDLSRFAGAPPDAAAGEKLFTQDCSECHKLDANAAGPALGAVFGHAAGIVAGYPYSAALAKSGITWTAAELDRWLANPQARVPGALMPMHLDNAIARGDIIAYLRSLDTRPQAGG